MSRPTISSIARRAVSSLRSEPIAGPSVVRRFIATDNTNHPKTSSIPYPYSANVIFPPSVISGGSINPKLLKPKRGWSVIEHLEKQERILRDPELLHKTWFHRRSKDRILPGSILTVVSYTNMDKTSTTSFSGVLMGQSRGGVCHSFRLRNIVNKVGVEISFKLLSPLIKEIRIVKRAEKAPRRGGIKAFRQANAYFIRERPELLRNLAGAIKEDTTRERREAKAAGLRK